MTLTTMLHWRIKSDINGIHVEIKNDGEGERRIIINRLMCHIKSRALIKRYAVVYTGWLDSTEYGIMLIMFLLVHFYWGEIKKVWENV